MKLYQRKKRKNKDPDVLPGQLSFNFNGVQVKFVSISMILPEPEKTDTEMSANK